MEGTIIQLLQEVQKIYAIIFANIKIQQMKMENAIGSGMVVNVRLTR